MKLAVLLCAALLGCGTASPGPDVGACSAANPSGHCAQGCMCAAGTCVGFGCGDRAAAQADTSCVLPLLPVGVVDTVVSYKPGDPAHGWGFWSPPPSGTATVGGVLLMAPGAWNDACSSPGVATGGDAWPGSATVVDTAHRLNGLGYAVFWPCHRPPPGFVHPAQVSDTICAHRWLADQLAALGVTGPLFLLGSSSGAHLVALDAYTVASAPPGLEDGSCPRSGLRPTTAGVVAWSGIYDLDSFVWTRPGPSPVTGFLGYTAASNPAGAAAASPTSYALLDAGAQPPALWGHGTADVVLPASQSAEMQTAALAAGDASTYVPWAGPEHAPALFAGGNELPFACAALAFLAGPR